MDRIIPRTSLASVRELESPEFSSFMGMLNQFAGQCHLRKFTDWSKVWEYPWLWFNGLSSVQWEGARVCDIGSELSPMPWYMASLGARVTLIENDEQYVPRWAALHASTGWAVGWKIVAGERLPFNDASFDVVTSYSVIEHQPEKALAVTEIARILAPEGIFAVSFDVCEPSLGMTFPSWNGSALTAKQFEELIWNSSEFGDHGNRVRWNFEDAAAFICWHLRSAPYHNYTVGAAILRRRTQGAR
jgi:SAM-dependent methyltransferase